MASCRLFIHRTITLSLALALGGCHIQPPASPNEVTRRRADLEAGEHQARAAEAAAQREAEAAREEHRNAAAAVADADASDRARAERNRAAAAEVEAYAANLAEARAAAERCDLEFERLIELRTSLGEYVAEPERDAALAGLEKCRLLAIPVRTQLHQDAQVVARREFAAEIEANFDHDYPRSKGLLVAAVRGDLLHVDLPNFTPWRPADAQAAVDAWCDTTALFTSISLRTRHGTHRCTPRESPQQSIARALQTDGIGASWLPVAAGGRATPQLPPAPEPFDPAERARRSTRLVAATHRLQAAEAALDHAEVGVAAVGREKTLLSQEVKANAIAAKGRPRAFPMLAAGAVFNVGALASFAVGMLSMARYQAIEDGKLRFASPAEREREYREARRAAIIGCLVAAPLAVIGIAASLAGARRKVVGNRISATSGGLQIRF